MEEKDKESMEERGDGQKMIKTITSEVFSFINIYIYSFLLLVGCSSYQYTTKSFAAVSKSTKVELLKYIQKTHQGTYFARSCRLLYEKWNILDNTFGCVEKN